jgi:hypothetical protein
MATEKVSRSGRRAYCLGCATRRRATGRKIGAWPAARKSARSKSAPPSSPPARNAAEIYPAEQRYVDGKRCRCPHCGAVFEPETKGRVGGGTLPRQAQARSRALTPYASKTSRSVRMPSNLCTSARFTTGRISIWFAPMRSRAKSSP